MKELIKKYKSFIMYAIFGVLTTLINICCYYLLYKTGFINNVSSTVIAWVGSVLFAFFTNRKYVFGSGAETSQQKLYELGKFFSCRLATGILDVAIMFIAVDLLHYPNMFWKVVSNVMVIIINYVASKFIVFKK